MQYSLAFLQCLEVKRLESVRSNLVFILGSGSCTGACTGIADWLAYKVIDDRSTAGSMKKFGRALGEQIDEKRSLTRSARM